MPNSLLRRLLGRAGADAEGTGQGEAFSLPGSLQAGSRVLLIASDDLTDLLFAMPLVEAIGARVDDVRIGLVCDERTSQLALSTDRFGEVIVVEAEALAATPAARKALEAEVGAEAWDVAILIGREADPRRDELALLSGATLRMGPDHPRAFPNLNCQVRPPATDGYPYDRALVWGRLLGLGLEGAPLRWPLDPKRERQMAQLVHFNKPRKQQRLIGIDPGVAKGGTRLGASNLAIVGNHVARTIDSRTIVLTAEEDDAATQELAGALSNAPLDLPRPTLLERIALLAQCDLFIGGNTDLLHFAVALGVPVLALVPGGEDPLWTPVRAQNFERIEITSGEAVDLASLMEHAERLLS